MSEQEPIVGRGSVELSVETLDQYAQELAQWGAAKGYSIETTVAILHEIARGMAQNLRMKIDVIHYDKVKY